MSEPDHFRDEMAQALRGAEKHIKAWLGALQFSAYSQPDRARLAHHQGEDGETTSHVSRSPEVWFEGVKGDLEGALKGAENTLSNEWMKRRDPRHNHPEADEDFAHAFEDKVATIAKAVLGAEQDIKNGVVRESKSAREALSWVREDLKRMVNVYVENRHEMTLREQEGGLLSLRARIMDGDSRAL